MQVFLKRIVLTFPIYFPKIFRICQTSWKPLRIKSFWITSNVTCFHDAKVERKIFSSSIFQVNHDDQIVSSILLIILVKTANEDCQMFLIKKKIWMSSPSPNTMISIWSIHLKSLAGFKKNTFDIIYTFRDISTYNLHVQREINR